MAVCANVCTRYGEVVGVRVGGVCVREITAAGDSQPARARARGREMSGVSGRGGGSKRE